MLKNTPLTIGKYLIECLKQTGIKHVFGIQGDYVLNFYSQLCNSDLKVINTCDEQGAGFAADSYARVAGFAAVCVTYSVGGLKMINSTAQAFAESSPVLIISGAPGMAERKHDPLLHHKVRSFQTQLNIFKEITVAQAVLQDSKTAAGEINRVIRAIKETKRPGYIELPRDMVDVEIDLSQPPLPEEKTQVDQTTLKEAIQEVLTMISLAKQPIVMVGVEIHRFGLQNLLLKFLGKTGLPFVTGVLGKSVVSETHPQFLGVYAGGMSPDDVRKAVEDADCFIALGPYLTDLATGIFTQHIDLAKAIVLSADKVCVRHHCYPDINIKCFLEALILAIPESKNKYQKPKVSQLAAFIAQPKVKITIERLFSCINTFLDDNTTVIAEPGDCLFGALDLRVHGMAEFISPAYYASLGFAVPASIGVQLAAENYRPLVLVGDGSFQMTGIELSTSLRYGLSPIVVIFNNGGYATFRSLIDGQFNDIMPWKYADIIKIFGQGEGYKVTTEDELFSALSAAKKNTSSPSIIDVVLDKHDYSVRLKKLMERLKNRVK